MLDSYLVAEGTIISANGDSEALDLSAAQSRVFLVSLDFAAMVEQESLDLSLWGSRDGQTWEAKPLASFPQQFYRGQPSLLVDMTLRPEVKYLRAHWEVNRWGRGPETPMFQVSLRMVEVPPELLAAKD
jgi:hypothetical protein